MGSDNLSIGLDSAARTVSETDNIEATSEGQ